jgi:hypothetical protein
MSLVSVTGANGTYFLDVTFKESFDFENTITQNPVQTGANISDHVINQPIVFTWEVGVSDCLASIVNGQFASTSSRSVSAFGILEGMWQNKEALTVNTSFQKLDNMVIRSFIPIRDKTTMTAMRATVTFQQIIVTSAVEISVNQKSIPTKNTSVPQTTGKSNSGPKPVAQSTMYKTVKIKNDTFFSSQAVYKGETMSLLDYFGRYSSSIPQQPAGSLDWTLTPIIDSSITSSTKFTINNSPMTYEQFLKTYGVS